jgi:hypothetical protein
MLAESSNARKSVRHSGVSRFKFARDQPQDRQSLIALLSWRRDEKGEGEKTGTKKKARAQD